MQYQDSDSARKKWIRSILFYERKKQVVNSSSKHELREFQVQNAMNSKSWDMAVKLRGRSFQRNLETYKLLSKMRPPKLTDPAYASVRFNVAVMNVGAPACGMNACVGSFVRKAISNDCRVLAIYNSFEGLRGGQVKVTGTIPAFLTASEFAQSEFDSFPNCQEPLKYPFSGCCCSHHRERCSRKFFTSFYCNCAKQH